MDDRKEFERGFLSGYSNASGGLVSPAVPPIPPVLENSAFATGLSAGIEAGMKVAKAANSNEKTAAG